MSATNTHLTKGELARDRLVDAAIKLVRQKGYAATRVEDICAEAGLTKGGFFHHFASKDELAIAAATKWQTIGNSLFEDESIKSAADPLQRLLAYVDLRKEIIAGGTDEFTCLAGTLAQEAHLTNPQIREAAGMAIFNHAAVLVPDIEAAKARYCPDADWSAESLAQFTQSSLQGAFILAKAQGGAPVARDMVDHLRRYIELLFTPKGED